MDTNPAQLGLKYFFCPTWPQIFFPGQSCPNRPQIWPRLKKKGAARLIETFSNNQTAANNWLGFTAGLASFDFLKKQRFQDLLGPGPLVKILQIIGYLGCWCNIRWSFFATSLLKAWENG